MLVSLESTTIMPAFKLYLFTRLSSATTVKENLIGPYAFKDVNVFN